MANDPLQKGSKKLVKSYELYWYAIGYHDGIRDCFNNDPSKEMIDYLLSSFKIDIGTIYGQGWQRGQKDMKEGLE